MQLMRMHRSEFHVNLTPPSQVSIKTRKNNNILILISKSVRVGPIVVLSIYNFLTKNNRVLIAILRVFYLSSFYRYI